MNDDLNTGIIGLGLSGKDLFEPNITCHNDIINLNDTEKKDKYLNLSNPETYLIKKLPELPQVFLDPNKHYKNEKKHIETCKKKKKLRKKKRR